MMMKSSRRSVGEFLACAVNAASTSNLVSSILRAITLASRFRQVSEKYPRAPGVPMSLRNPLFMIVCFALACSGSTSSVKKTDVLDLEPSSRCYEGSYRIYDEGGVVRVNTPMVARYLVGKDRITIEEVESGSAPTEATYEIENGTARTEVEDLVLSGPIAVSESETVLEVETRSGPESTNLRLVLTDPVATEHMSIQSPDGSGHRVQVLVRIDDDRCEERMKLFEEDGRKTLSRRAEELLETAVENPGTGEVLLAYAWPRQLNARVWADSSWKRNDEQSGSRTPFALTTEPHADGMLLKIQNRFGETVTDVSRELKRAIHVSDYLLYPSVIDPDGVVTAIHEYDEVAASVGALIGPDNPAPGLLSHEAMIAEVRKLWDPMVAAWRGSALKIGKAYTTQTKVPQVLPTGGRAMVGATTEFVVWGYVPCTPTEAESKCVVIQLTQQTDPTFVEEAMRDLYKEQGKEMPEMQHYEQLFSTVTVTDPDTLLPFEYHEVNSARFVLAPEDGDRIETDKMDQKSLTFHYD